MDEPPFKMAFFKTNLEYLYNAEGNKFYLAEHLFDAKNEQKIKNLFGKRRTSSSETLLPT